MDGTYIAEYVFVRSAVTVAQALIRIDADCFALWQEEMLRMAKRRRSGV